VHEEEQRDVDLCAEATVREANASGLNEFGRRGLVRVVTHNELLFNVPSRQLLEADRKVQARLAATLELVS
jgi:hypothetical protein